MVAELSYENGQAQVIYREAGGTPWHREGIPVPDNTSYDDIFGLILFDYPLEKKPYYFPNPENESEMIVADDSFYVWRPDIKKKLGRVGSEYEIVTNKEAFEILRPLIDNRQLQIETGGVLRDGADAWLMGRWNFDSFPDSVRNIFRNEILPYSTVMANHSGRRSILIGNTDIRIVCANTLAAAETSEISRWESVIHNRNASENLKVAADNLFNKIIARYEIIARQYKLLQDIMLNDKEFDNLVLDVAAPDPVDYIDKPMPGKSKPFNPEAKMAALIKERADIKRKEIKRLWFQGIGHDGRPTAWWALNGLIQAIDFNSDLWPTRDGSYRTASLLTGTLSLIKNKVMDNLVSFAKDKLNGKS